jgi:hypothetical protein
VSKASRLSDFGALQNELGRKRLLSTARPVARFLRAFLLENFPPIKTALWRGQFLRPNH